MKNKLARVTVFLKTNALVFFTILAVAFTQDSFGQLTFSSSWQLISDQFYTISGAGATSVAATNQVMSGTLFTPFIGPYAGNASGNGQRCSPKLGDGNDGGWNSDAGAVEGRYMEFEVHPVTGYDMRVTNITFSIGNRSSPEILGSVYYYVGASNAGFTIATGTALGTALGSKTVNQYTAYGFVTNIPVASGNKIYLRIYPYNEGANTTGKYSCNRYVAISGTTTSPNVTAITFTTPGGCLTDRVNVSWTGPYGFNPATTTLLAFIKTGSAVTVGTPTNTLASYTTVNTVLGAGQVYENDAAATCVYKGTGTDVLGNHSGLTITGLAANTTYHLLIFKVTNATNTYAEWAAGSGNSLSAPLVEPDNHPTSFAKGAVTTSNIALNWTAALPGLQAPSGYMIKASTGSTPADPGGSNPLDGADPVNQTVFTLGQAYSKVTPNTATSFNSFTGFTAGTMYHFRINSYTNTGSCINYKPGGPFINVATLPNAVSLPSFNINGTSATVSWIAATGYVPSTQSTLVFVKASATVITAGTPTADPYIYNPSTDVSAPILPNYELDAGAKCVYRGDGTSVNLTNLTPGTTYQLLVITVVDAVNSDIVISNSYSAYATATVFAGNTYTWTGASATPTDWGTAGNWNPARITAAVTDILVFNSGGTITPTGLPVNQTIAKLQITNNTELVYKSTTAAVTLKIGDNNGLLNTDLIVAAGSALTLDMTPSFQTFLTLNANTTGDISGTLNVNAGCTFTMNSSGNFTTVSGLLKNSGTVVSSASNMSFTNTGTYEAAANGGTKAIALATWLSGSTCLVTGITNATQMDGQRQTFSKFIWDCPLQTSTFNLGSTITLPGTVPPIFEVTDSFVVRRTNTGILQLTSPAGQRDVYCGNYIQYGGNVAINCNTTDAGGQRSMSVNNSFYVTDSLENNPQFHIVYNSTGANTYGRLFVGGSVVMRLKPVLPTTVSLAKTGPGVFAELWFTGIANQSAKFSTITGAISFVTAQNAAGFNVNLGSDARAGHFKLSLGTFNIGSNTLTIDSTVSYPVPGTATIGGSSASNLIMGLNGAAGTLNFASGSRVLKDFTQMAGNSVTLGTALAIAAGASPGRDSIGAGATLITNDNLTLRSDINGTARMARLPASATVVGKVTVERYLPMNLTAAARRWRLLTAPFKSVNSPTISAGWQAGGSTSSQAAPVNPRPGYGTQITKSTSWSALDGYDVGSTNSSSIYYYSNALNVWQTPATTNTVKITDNSGCYMLFARGHRGIPVGNTSVAAAPTTLDPKGELNIGDVTIPMAATGYQTVGNPYASAILLDNVLFNDTLGKDRTVYLWDPKTSGSYNVGKFITCSGNGDGTYTYSANTSNYDSRPGVVESSGAFMVKCNGGGPGDIVFHESDKTITSSTIGIASRPAGRSRSAWKIPRLYTDLFVLPGAGAAPLLTDGVVNTYNKNYKNEIDHFDAPKLTSFNSKEELSIRRDNQLFAIERRKAVKKTDTIFLNISKLNQAAYQFGFRPAEFDQSYSAFIKDKFLQTVTAFSLCQPSNFAFSITADSASAAADRFCIIFRKAATPDNRRLKTALNNEDIALDWKNGEEDEGEPQYVERSADGIHFTTLATKESANSATREMPGEWLDENPLPGIYYYRIRFNNGEDETIYSNIAKVTKPAIAAAPGIFPNPVTDGKVNLNMGQLPEGAYTIKIINSVGLVVYSRNMIHQNRYAAEKIDLGNKNTKGVYRLEILSENKTVTTLNMVIQ